VEPGERPDDAALRETVEETGIAVRHPDAGPTVLHLDEHPGPDGHVHLDLRYLLLADRTTGPVGAGETTGDGPGATLRWMDASEAAAVADRSLMRAVAALQGTLR
jgi:8-oxo-dGTP pyrophosphatase MutT (NUDIX family)